MGMMGGRDGSGEKLSVKGCPTIPDTVKLRIFCQILILFLAVVGHGICQWYLGTGSAGIFRLQMIGGREYRREQNRGQTRREYVSESFYTGFRLSEAEIFDFPRH